MIACAPGGCRAGCRRWGRTSLWTVTISQRHWDDLVAHAREEAPNECCGYLRAREGVVEEVVRAENVRHSPYLIVSLGPEPPQVRAWRIEDGRVEEEELVVAG